MKRILGQALTRIFFLLCHIHLALNKKINRILAQEFTQLKFLWHHIHLGSGTVQNQYDSCSGINMTTIFVCSIDLGLENVDN